jgi:hypothetical protein
VRLAPSPAEHFREDGVLNIHVIAGAIVAMSAALLAQSQPAPESSQSGAAPGAMVHFEGCAYEQQDGFILSDTRDLSKPPNALESEAKATGPVYKLEGADKEGLTPFRGKRVAVVGRIQPGAGDQPGALKITSIREVMGQCEAPAFR